MKDIEEGSNQLVGSYGDATVRLEMTDHTLCGCVRDRGAGSGGSELWIDHSIKKT